MMHGIMSLKKKSQVRIIVGSSDQTKTASFKHVSQTTFKRGCRKPLTIGFNLSDLQAGN
jgi:hypothetical protein